MEQLKADLKDMELLTDLEVQTLREDWNPNQYDDEPDEVYKEVMKAIARNYYEMPIEDYRQYLMDMAVEASRA